MTHPLMPAPFGHSYWAWSFGYDPAVQMYRFGHSSPRYSLVRFRALGLFSIVKDRSAYLHRPAGKTLISIVDQPQREY